MISVIVPVYNIEKYLKRCIDSIIVQTYKNLEIILVDDGSTDESGVICDKYKDLDNRIKVIHKKNEGAAIARNIGIECAEGEYVAFVDSDDYIHPKMFELLHTTLVRNKADISVCDISDVPFDLESEQGVEEEHIITGKKSYFNEIAHQNLLYIVIWNKLYKKELFKNIKFPEGRKYEDLWFSAIFFSNVKRAVFINNKLYYYYQRENSLSKEKISMKLITDQIEAMENTCKVMKENGCYDSQKEMGRHVSNTIIDYYKNIDHYFPDCKSKAKKILRNLFKREMKLNENVFSYKQLVYKVFLFSPELAILIREIRK